MTQDNDRAIARVEQAATDVDVDGSAASRISAAMWLSALNDMFSKLEEAIDAHVPLVVLWELFRDAEECCAAVLVANCDQCERQQMVLMYSEARSLLNQIPRLLRARSHCVVV
jgi:hypothetical protein